MNKTQLDKIQERVDCIFGLLIGILIGSFVTVAICVIIIFFRVL